jgi:hypothetical protein
MTTPRDTAVDAAAERGIVPPGQPAFEVVS